MGMSWDFFIKRRRVDPGTFIKQHKIRTHEDFVSALARRGISPPAEEVVAILLAEHALGETDLWDAFRPDVPKVWDDFRPVVQEEPKKKLEPPAPVKKATKTVEKKTKTKTAKQTAKRSRTSSKKTSTAS